MEKLSLSPDFSLFRSLFVTFFGASSAAPLLEYSERAFIDALRRPSTPLFAKENIVSSDRTEFAQTIVFQPEHWDSFGRILSFGRRALLEVGQSLSVLVSSELFGDREDSTLF